MRKKTALRFASALGLFGLIGILVEAGPFSISPAKAAQTNTRDCANITFGTGTTSDSGRSVTSSSYSSEGLVFTLDSATTAYSYAKGNPARMGKTSAVGSLTFSFPSCVVSAARLYAYQYGTDGDAVVSVSTSAISQAKTATISATDVPTLTDLSGTNIYLFTGLDNNAGDSSTTITISSDGSNRFYLAKILFTLNGTPDAPTSSSSAAASSNSSSSSDMTTSSSSAQATYYRVAPNTSSGTTANVYSVSYLNGGYQGTLVKTLTKGAYYTTYEDVAAYFQAFAAMPGNYMCADGDDSSGYSTTKNKAYAVYGEDARLWFTYHRTTGYMTQIPVYNTYGDGTNEATYYEIDISTSWTSYSGNRGAERLMATPYGIQTYGVVPVVFHTTDHYSTFTEYYNYSGGWGPSFASRAAYTAPTTVTYTVA